VANHAQPSGCLSTPVAAPFLHCAFCIDSGATLARLPSQTAIHLPLPTQPAQSCPSLACPPLPTTAHRSRADSLANPARAPRLAGNPQPTHANLSRRSPLLQTRNPTTHWPRTRELLHPSVASSAGPGKRHGDIETRRRQSVLHPSCPSIFPYCVRSVCINNNNNNNNNNSSIFPTSPLFPASTPHQTPHRTVPP
jgi:hypothetical protein